MRETIFETPELSYFERVKNSWMKAYYDVFYLGVALTLIGFIFDLNAKYALLLITFGFFIIISMRILAFKNYIFKIEGLDDSIVLFYQSGIFNQVIKEVVIKKSNFKIRYLRNGFFSSFLIEQKKPYKMIINQYCIGSWQKKDSMEILREYASSIQYFDSNTPSNFP